MKHFDLNGKNAIVTGGTKGIGRAIAELLAEAGANVAVSSRHQEDCDRVATAIATQSGRKAVGIACHIGDKTQIDALVEKSRIALGPIDILVCNAAINPYMGPLAQIPDETFDKIMATNIKSNLLLARAAQPDMIARGGGAVIIVSSIGGLRGSPVLGAYGISKAADMQLIRSLAVEWGPHNIRVNGIAPGLVKTDFARALWEDPKRAEQRIARTPLARLGEPRDIAGAALLLASEAGAWITGQTIVIDGGVTIG